MVWNRASLHITLFNVYLQKSYIYESGTFVVGTHCVRTAICPLPGHIYGKRSGIARSVLQYQKKRANKKSGSFGDICRYRSLCFIYSKFGGPNEDWRQKEFWYVSFWSSAKQGNGTFICNWLVIQCRILFLPQNFADLIYCANKTKLTIGNVGIIFSPPSKTSLISVGFDPRIAAV